MDTLQLIEEITLNSDAEDVVMDIIRKRKTTTREKSLAHALMEIYKIVHSQGKCKHPEWEMEIKKI